jgi:hypothetical protein
MDKNFRDEVLTELSYIKSLVMTAGAWEEWRSIGTRLCDLDTKIDNKLFPYKNEIAPEDY